MNSKTFTYLLEHPETIATTQVSDLRSIIDQFPFFQSAHALYLKALKNQESFSYNKALKVTAAHTTDRSVLFDYITSPLFSQNEISSQIKQQDTHLRNLIINELQDVSIQVETEELQKAEKILDPDFFIPRTTSEEQLEIGKPLSFDKDETHSFNEWLKLSHFKPIDRQISTVIEKHQNTSGHTGIIEEHIKTTLSTRTDSRKRKQRIIDSFIQSNPKIEITTPATTAKKNLAKERLIPSEVLMTETLARVYIEQKNYKKAKQAYRILSLKYPEKSSFFADQIRAVVRLEENSAL